MGDVTRSGEDQCGGGERGAWCFGGDEFSVGESGSGGEFSAGREVDVVWGRGLRGV